MGIFSRSGSEQKNEPACYLAGGSELRCPHCRHSFFRESKAQLNTAAMSLFDLDWANKSATTLICAQCSSISWFFDAPVRMDSHV